MAKSKKQQNQLNETGEREGNERRQQKKSDKPESGTPASERRKVKRRRQIDPTTCEREYSDQEIVFMQAMDEYKRSSGRMFPTCSEILEVIIKLGYRQVEDAQTIFDPNAPEPTVATEESSKKLTRQQRANSNSIPTGCIYPYATSNLGW